MKICMFSLTACNRNYITVRKETRILAEAGHDIRVIAYLNSKTDLYEESDGARIFRMKLLPFSLQILWPLLLRTIPISYNAGVEETTRYAWSPSIDCDIVHHRYSKISKLLLYLEHNIYKILRSLARYLVWLLPYKYIWYLGYYYRSFWVARQEPADVYHAHDLITLPVAWLCSRLTGGKLVYDSHELWLDRWRMPERTKLNRYFVKRIESFLIRRTDVNIAPGVSVGQELSRRYHIADPTVIFNVPYYHSYERSSLFRDKLGIPNEEKIILYAGNISWGRGVEKGIQSLKYLSGVSSVIFGSGSDSYVDGVRELVKNEGLTDRVYFFEAVPFDEVSLYAMSADVGLVLHQNVGLNYYYVSPNKLFECMAAGLPVVGSNFPDLKMFIEGYNFGVTCDPHNPKEVANAINYILSDEKRYEEMKRNALEAAKIFNWENESKKLLAIYEGLSNITNV